MLKPKKIGKEELKNKWEKHSEDRLKPIHTGNYINYNIPNAQIKSREC